MPPPELAGDAPVLDIAHPLVKGVDPLLGHEFNLAAGNCINGFLRDGFANCITLADFVDCHKPLVGQHGFNHLPSTATYWHHVFMRHGFFKKAQGLQIRQHGLAAFVAVQTLVRRGSVVVDAGIERKNRNQRQVVPQCHLIVIEIVRAGNFHAATAKSRVHIAVGNDGDLPVAQGQIDEFAN